MFIVLRHQYLAADNRYGKLVKQAAGFPDIKIVGIDWLLSSIDSGCRVDETKYLMDTPDSPTAQKQDTTKKKDNTKKENSIKKEDNIEDEGTSKKDDTVEDKATSKKRGRNGKAKLASPESDEEKEPPTKKHKETRVDGQRAKSRAVNIPIDEGCQLQGEYHLPV